MIFLDLAVSWGRVGIGAFGGGAALIPLMKTECVDIRHWMTDEQFMEGLALANSLPGPISAKMSVFIGLDVAGLAGATVAFLAVMAPPILLMVALATMYGRFRDSAAVQGAMAAVKPAVVGLLAWTVIDLMPSGIRDWKTGLLAATALVALALRVHPVIVVGSAFGIGALWFKA